MFFVKDDHVVETLSTDGTNHPFYKRILPWRARRNQHLLVPKTRDALVKVGSVDLT
jgi:hypothetical protein